MASGNRRVGPGVHDAKSIRTHRWTLMAEANLPERLGGAFAVAAVVDHFSDAVVQSPVVGQRSQYPGLREWHTNNLGRLPGIKFLRTLWVCAVAGGPFVYSATRPGSTPVGLEAAHRELRISPDEFDADAGRADDRPVTPSDRRAA
jgi:hemoglobin